MVDSVNAGSGLEVPYDHNLVLDDDHDAILEESFPPNTRPGQPFTNADPFLQTQFQYNPSNVEGQSALNLPLGAGKIKTTSCSQHFLTEITDQFTLIKTSTQVQGSQNISSPSV